MDIVICAEDWGRHPSTVQFIAQKLAARHRVVWVESLGLRRPSPNLTDLSRMIHKACSLFKRTKSPDRTNGNLIVYTPKVVPLHGSRTVRTFNNNLLTYALKRLLRQEAMEEPVLMVACPAAEGLVGRLGERKSVYYCADKYAVFPGMCTSLVAELEARLLQKVDEVIVTSRNLLIDKNNVHRRVTHIPHGVHTALFGTCQDPTLEVAEEIKALQRPVLGYHGLIQDLIDFRILKAIASRRPDWSLALIGDVLFDAKNLPMAPNVHYLGRKPFRDLPMYIKGFDVCLIPYKVVDRTLYANPVKLREYLAAGKPVVSTPLPEVIPYKDIVSIAASADEFIAAVEDHLANDGPDKVLSRMQAVAGADWDIVARQVEDHLAA